MLRLGLGSKFVAVVAGILMLTLSVISYFVFYTQDRLFQEHLAEKAQILGRFVALISPEVVLSYDYFSLNNFVKEVTTTNDMVYAVIYDPRGKSLTDYMNRDNPIIQQAIHETSLNEIGQLAPHLVNNSMIVSMTFPIVHRNETVATVTLGASRARLQEASHRLLLDQLTANGATIAFLSIAIYMAFRIAALRPIHLLGAGAQRVAQGNLDTPIGLYPNDELGQLARAFDGMMLQLKNTIREKDDTMLQLRDLNRTLEQRVQERTVALAASEARIRAVIDHVGEGILTIDEHGHVESLNPAGQRIFGVSDAGARDLRLDDFFHDDGLRAFRSLIAANSAGTPANGAPLQPTELQARRIGGKSFGAEVVVTPMRQPERGLLYVCIVRDISRRKETERQLAEAQENLLASAHKAGMADIATSVLHNIGNVLNSVQVSSDVMQQLMRNSKLAGLIKANQLLKANVDDLGRFLTEDEKGKLLPQYYLKIGEALDGEQEQLRAEGQSLAEKIRMMREVISTQQSYARQGLFEEEKNLEEIIDDALRVQAASLANADVKLDKHYARIPKAVVQNAKLLQVLINVVKNAKEAMDGNEQLNRPRILRIETGQQEDGLLYVDFVDNGAGVAAENVTRIFEYGFTTKPKGHGFGLHGSANAMTEMGGKLTWRATPSGQGACFRVSVRAAVHTPAARVPTDVGEDSFA